MPPSRLKTADNDIAVGSADVETSNVAGAGRSEVDNGADNDAQTQPASATTTNSSSSSSSSPPSSSPASSTNVENSSSKQKQQQQQQPEAPKEKPEYNQKWFGYAVIMLTSLLNWTAVSSVPNDQRRQNWRMAISFGVITFLVSCLVLIQDRTQKGISTFHYSKARDGYLEGYVLLSMCIWWIVGVAYMTSPGGIAYIASNIYYSAWFALFSCMYTLDEWSKEKDILSIEEITGVSYTLKSWWIHFLSACVVFGSSIDLHITLGNEEFDDTSFGIALGLVSMVVSMFFILMHYDFFSACNLEEGGWLELSFALFLVVCWIVGLSVLTQDGGVAATMEGNQCARDDRLRGQLENCTLILYQQDDAGTVVRYEMECGEIPRQIPGSNVFFASWICMLSVVYVAFRWKAAQAIKFAQAKEERAQKYMGENRDVDDDVAGASDYDEDE